MTFATIAPLRTGAAFAITVAVFYALCGLAWAAAPGPFLSLMNSLFHGMDFTGMVRPGPFDWSGFVIALLLLSAWAWLAGAFFAWTHNRLTLIPPSTIGVTNVA